MEPVYHDHDGMYVLVSGISIWRVIKNSRCQKFEVTSRPQDPVLQLLYRAVLVDHDEFSSSRSGLTCTRSSCKFIFSITLRS